MKKILTLLAVAFAFGVQAQVNPELNKWIVQSFSYYPKIQELATTSEISAARVSIAQSNYMPNINGTATYNYVDPVSQTQFPVSATETKTLLFQPHNNYNVNVGLTQTIWDFGKTKAQVEKAKAELQGSKQNVEAARLQVAAQVTSIYYSMIYLKKSIQLQDTVIAFYEKNKKIIEGKIRQGDALHIDLINVENSIDQEKNRKIEFQRQYERQAALMTYTTGLSEEPTGTEFDFQYATAEELNAASNPDVLAAEQRIAAAKADARYIDNNRLPSLSFQAGAGFKNGYQPDIDEMRFNYLAGVTLNVPIFQGSRLRQNVVVARKSLELSEISKTNLTNTLQKDWQSARADLVAYQQQEQNAATQVDASREALRLTQVRYERGVATYIDLVFASANLQRAMLTQLQFKYQATLASTELTRLQGVKFWQE
ncbi:MAG TPA: TolC family protein [Cyclobacteriaceae bacterium]|nr:TolC family protein [Cyclobacteriaceae bacterium]HMV08681.1 TolC family protein [Cyclobacteriaceae bacterium]HMV91563.1 TolC family protein [Cyclobacteriaceae bacterium]HMX00110.1 TolC family protein [Cyclobacteriaceae bacterium]HMX49028.1 TolC family protein [Cyclobacteriaceae bacterium]